MSEMDDARAAVDRLQGEIDRLHLKTIEVAARTKAAIASIERLQIERLQIADKPRRDEA